jgi:putative NADH-flavin reductase
MKITVFGATGRTGKILVGLALAAGHEVTAFVRDPTKPMIAADGLKVARGDATDPSAVERAIRGADAVVSVMTTSASRRVARSGPLARSTRNIVSAMREAGLRRLIVSSAGVPQPGDESDIRLRLIMGFGHAFMRASFEDTIESVEIARASGLDWTVVRMAGPSNAPPSGAVRASLVRKAMSLRISRADAAAFILEELAEPRHVGQSVVIASVGPR